MRVYKYTNTTEIISKSKWRRAKAGRSGSEGEKENIRGENKLKEMVIYLRNHRQMAISFSFSSFIFPSRQLKSAAFYFIFLAHKISIIVKSFLFVSIPHANLSSRRISNCPWIIDWMVCVWRMKFGAKNHSLRFYFTIFVQIIIVRDTQCDSHCAQNAIRINSPEVQNAEHCTNESAVWCLQTNAMGLYRMGECESNSA